MDEDVSQGLKYAMVSETFNLQRQNQCHPHQLVLLAITARTELNSL